MDLSILIGGEAGMGVMVSGRILSRAFSRGGYNVFAINEYPSLIRGGHNFFLIRVSDDEVKSQVRRIDIIIALDKLTVFKHYTKLSKKGIVVIDCKDEDVLHELSIKNYLLIPLTQIVENIKAPGVARNSVALGGVIALLKYDLGKLIEVIESTFTGDARKFNVEACKLGYEYVTKEYSDLVEKFEFNVKPLEGRVTRLFISGNEAIGLGAIRAGMKIFVAYPMSPATSLLHFLADMQKYFDIVVLQPESEIAAINMVIGSWFAGARAMTATSGGGFSLMVEALGQAGITETPVVIVLVQRQGPSTGLPTHTAQGDLRFVLHASQGEFPRVVIAPGDIEEAFYLTVEAFNIAEKYQLPVIILSDKYLAESYASIPPFDLDKAKVERGDLITDYFEGDYKRYKITPNGISPIALPGTKNAIIKANTLEHDEYGFSTEDPEIVTKMIEKRFRKLISLSNELRSKGLWYKVHSDDGEITIISWGSTKGPILEAMKLLEKDSIKAKFIQLVFLSPFPKDELKKLISETKVVTIENNMTGQLASLLREHLLISPDYQILKYDGNPFYPEEIYEKVKKVVTHG